MILNALTVAGVDRKSLLVPGTLRVEGELNARNTCAFALRDPIGTARPLVGQTVVVMVDSIVRFAGTIDRYSEKNLSNRASATTVEYQLDCVDYNQLADRHLVAEAYDDFTMKTIAQDIVTDHLAADGVTLDAAFPTGPIIDYIQFNYDSAAKAFDELSEITGYFWDIGYDKVLRFLDRTTMTAPASLTQSAGIDLAYSLESTRTREQYRNEQLLRGGMTRTQTVQVEEQKGDGATQSFLVALPIASVPTVKVNGVAKTVGIRQVETGKDWYWQESSDSITQEFSATKLTSSDTLRVEYTGYFPLLTIHREGGAVADRQTVEGGSGLYQQLEHDEGITQSSFARDRAAGLIRRFGVINTELRFASRVAGWQAGQLLSVARRIRACELG